MRAKEFTIDVNIPINITMNADGSVDVDTGNDSEDEQELEQNPVMVPPLQQSIEMQKSAQGKESPVIDTITQDSELGAEDGEDEFVGNKVNPVNRG